MNAGDGVSVPKLTKKQRAICQFISDRIKTHGYPPTYKEIAKAFKLRAINSAATHVRTLMHKGLITRDTNVARGLRLCDTGWPWELKTSHGDSLRLVWSRRT